MKEKDRPQTKIRGHLIEKNIEIQDFQSRIQNLGKGQIIVTPHALFRLAERQRKVFKEKVIIEYILNRMPIMVGIQYNKNFAVFYEYSKKEALRIILDVKINQIEVVTFYIINKNQIPK